MRGQVKEQRRKSHLHICLLVPSVAVSKGDRILYKMERRKEKNQNEHLLNISIVFVALPIVYQLIITEADITVPILQRRKLRLGEE